MFKVLSLLAFTIISMSSLRVAGISVLSCFLSKEKLRYSIMDWLSHNRGWNAYQIILHGFPRGDVGVSVCRCVVPVYGEKTHSAYMYMYMYSQPVWCVTAVPSSYWHVGERDFTAPSGAQTMRRSLRMDRWVCIQVEMFLTCVVIYLPAALGC